MSEDEALMDWVKKNVGPVDMLQKFCNPHLSGSSTAKDLHLMLNESIGEDAFEPGDHFITVGMKLCSLAYTNPKVMEIFRSYKTQMMGEKLGIL